MEWDSCAHLFCCPRCGAEGLVTDQAALRCVCGSRYPIRGGILRLPGARQVPKTLGQSAMRFRPLVLVYDLFWRRLTFPFVTSIPFSREVMVLLAAHHLQEGARVLDLACGPGTYTRRFAAAVGAGGLAVGVDASLPMLERAVSSSRSALCARIKYAQAGADLRLFRDSQFDGVNCAGAMHLFDRPDTVLDRVLACLKPGGILSGMTFCATPLAGLNAAFRNTGLTLFVPERLEAVFRERGFEDYRGLRSRRMLLFSARKPC